MRTPGLVLAGCLCWPGVSPAQQASLTTGGGVAKVDQLTSVPIATLAADAMIGLEHLALQFSGVTTNHQNIGNDTRAHASLRWSGARDGWQVSIGPGIELGTDVRNPWTMAWSGDLAVRRELGPAWIGVSAGEGVTSPDDQRISFGRRGLMAGLHIGPVSLRGGLDMVIVRDSVLRDGVLFGELRTTQDPSLYRTRTRRVNDASVTLELSLPSIAVEGTLGRRSGDDIRGLTWWELGAAVPVADAITMVLSTSRRAADPVLTLRGSRTTTFGLRLALPGGPSRATVPIGVEVTRETEQLVRVVFALPGGSTARVMGEMTGWRAVELEPVGRGKFAGWFLVGSGTYRINISLDQGPWIAPPGMPRVEDGFGGLVGLLRL